MDPTPVACAVGTKEDESHLKLSIETWLRIVMALLLLATFALLGLFFAGIVEGGTFAVVTVIVTAVAFVLSRVLTRREATQRTARAQASSSEPRPGASLSNGKERRDRQRKRTKNRR